MALSPEAQAQLEAQKQQCIFCKMVRKEIPAKPVFEDEKTLALLDIYPAVKGHLLFMPKEHYPLMPYLPQEEFARAFGILPQISRALQGAMVAPAVNVFIANGGAAGQQSYHFLLHVLPRETDDHFLHFFLKPKHSPQKEVLQKLAQQLQQRIKAFFAQVPSPWHKDTGTRPAFLQKIVESSTVLHEDEKVLLVAPEKEVVSGEMHLYAKQEEKELAKLSAEDCIHLFALSSIAATTAFEILQAQGTNLILKAGMSDDNPDGKLRLVVLPRKQNDALQGLLWQPQQPKYNLDEVTGKIKDKMWRVKFQVPNTKHQVVNQEKTLSPQEEIRRALQRVK